MLLDRGAKICLHNFFPSSGVFVSDFVNVSLDLFKVSVSVCGICLHHTAVMESRPMYIVLQ